MFKVTMKNCSLVFTTIEDAMIYIECKSEMLFVDGAFVKISKLEDLNV